MELVFFIAVRKELFSLLPIFSNNAEGILIINTQFKIYDI